MKETERYLDHIKECWNFTKLAVEDELRLSGVVATNIKIKIFEKYLSPYHYFLEDKEKQTPNPTEAQIKYAKSLKIKNPENYTKKTLSEKIKEVLND